MNSNQALSAGKQPTGFSLYRRLLGQLSGHWFMFCLALCGNALLASVDAGMNYLFKPILDQGFTARDAHFIRYLPLWVMGLLLLRGVGILLSNNCMTWVGRSVILQYRQQIFNYLMRMPASQYDQSTPSTLLSTLLYNVEQVASACTESISTLVQSMVMIIGLLCVMLINSWQLTLLYFFILPFMALIIRFSSRRMRRYSSLIQTSVASVAQHAEESISGYKIVRMYLGQNSEHAKFLSANEETRRREMKLVGMRSLGGVMVQLLAGSALALTLYVVIDPQSSLQLTAGSFTALVLSMFSMLKPMKDLTNVNSNIQKGLSAAQSIYQLIDGPEESNTGSQTLTRVQGKISFENVNFRYQGTDKEVLNNITLQIPAGKTVAFVGRSGSGKTSLVNLLPRFYEIEPEGRILLDDIDIRNLKLQSLRSQIALVSQEVMLFNDTVRNNIAYGCNAHFSREEIEAASRAAYAEEFIQKLPQGYDTMIGDKGMLLSGGQRQRLAIARAILKNAPVLILDEATSALDNQSERYIQQALQTLKQNRTTLIVAHRLSTIEEADWIVVLDQGIIVEQGTHQQLLLQSKFYSKLQSAELLMAEA